jgi:hypothetical protein
MHNSLLLPVIAIVALTVYKIFSIIVNRQKDAAFARQRNCQPAPAVTWDGFLGIKVIKEMQAADQKNMFMNLLNDRVAQMSEKEGRYCPTFSYRVLGKQGFFTADPKNIQAILAHQFEDFELGALRRKVMGEPLGDGIVSISRQASRTTNQRVAVDGSAINCVTLQYTSTEIQLIL